MKSYTKCLKLFAGLMMGIALSSTAKAQESSFSPTLVEATRPASAVYVPGARIESAAGYREETHLQPQNAGQILYIDRNLIVTARTNGFLDSEGKIQPIGDEDTVAIVQKPLCYRGTLGGEIRTGRRTTLPLHTMHIVAILNESVEFPITKDWLWNDLRPLLRREVTDRFCGGRTQNLIVDIQYFGLEHNFYGQAHPTVDFEYPSAADILDDLSDRPPDINAIKDVRSHRPFVSAQFLFWDKIEPEYGGAIPVFGTVSQNILGIAQRTDRGIIVPGGGVYQGNGSYYEAFYPQWAAGAGLLKVAKDMSGAQNDLYEFPTSVSFRQFIELRAREVAETRAIMKAREEARFNLGDVLMALGSAMRAARCVPDMTNFGTVAERDKIEWQKRNCS